LLEEQKHRQSSIAVVTPFRHEPFRTQTTRFHCVAALVVARLKENLLELPRSIAGAFSHPSTRCLVAAR
jgi:hypothetical protein